MESVPAAPAVEPMAAPAARSGAGTRWRTVLRHRWPLRLMHWINLACMLALVGSGLQVFNAHPALYWGQASTFDAPAFAATAERAPSSNRGRAGYGRDSSV